tara:strand:- start:290 stop:982 length:693 start_codon:yes stop_codon:yes gene_type:complete
MSTSTYLPDLKISIPAKAPESKVPALSRITNKELPPRIQEIIDPRDHEILRDAHAQGSQIVFYGEVEATCAICLQKPSGQKPSGMITMTKCLHFFCKSCQQQWQKRSDNCAVCRQPLAIQPEQPEQPEQPDTDSYESDGPVYDPTAPDIFYDDDLTEEDVAEISRLMVELEPPTEQELADSNSHLPEWWYDSLSDETSSDDDDYDMSDDDNDNDMIASHENFQRTNIITI